VNQALYLDQSHILYPRTGLAQYDVHIDRICSILLFGDPLPIATGKGIVPQPRLPREQQQEQLTRDLEIDPHNYYPPDVHREPLKKLVNPEEVDLVEIAKVMGLEWARTLLSK
jgi:hypothetical protein